MKRTFILLLLAVVCVAQLAAKSEKHKPIYFIDGQIVENFDGSQIVGKNIIDYRMDAKKRIHIIFTSEFRVNQQNLQAKSFSSDEQQNKEQKGRTQLMDKKVTTNEYIYIVNGQLTPYEKIKTMNSANIKSITVIKNKALFKKYIKRLNTNDIQDNFKALMIIKVK